VVVHMTIGTPTEEHIDVSADRSKGFPIHERTTARFYSKPRWVLNGCTYAVFIFQNHEGCTHSQETGCGNAYCEPHGGSGCRIQSVDVDMQWFRCSGLMESSLLWILKIYVGG